MNFNGAYKSIMIRNFETIRSEPLQDDVYMRYIDGDCNIPHPRLLGLASELPSTSKVLDIGAGFGRASMPFALRGMEVTALDEVSAYTDELERMTEDGVVYRSIRDECPTEADLGTFDVVLVNDVLFHAESTDEALAILQWSYDRLKAGGYMWANYIVED
jgi:2-polyprenyl-3-methyl-5-hydroxy-6-metoxy-1,4-benzoquinol methylase